MRIVCRIGVAATIVSDVTINAILRRRLLGSEAVYRVLAEHGDTVLVEVVEAPGLTPGSQLRLTAAVARSLACDEAPGAAVPREPGVALPRFKRPAGA